jgi:hypothetical protein
MLINDIAYFFSYQRLSTLNSFRTPETAAPFRFGVGEITVREACDHALERGRPILIGRGITP